MLSYSSSTSKGRMSRDCSPTFSKDHGDNSKATSGEYHTVSTSHLPNCPLRSSGRHHGLTRGALREVRTGPYSRPAVAQPSIPLRYQINRITHSSFVRKKIPLQPQAAGFPQTYALSHHFKAKDGLETTSLQDRGSLTLSNPAEVSSPLPSHARNRHPPDPTGISFSGRAPYKLSPSNGHPQHQLPHNGSSATPANLQDYQGGQPKPPGLDVPSMATGAPGGTISAESAAFNSFVQQTVSSPLLDQPSGPDDSLFSILPSYIMRTPMRSADSPVNLNRREQLSSSEQYMLTMEVAASELMTRLETAKNNLRRLRQHELSLLQTLTESNLAPSYQLKAKPALVLGKAVSNTVQGEFRVIAATIEVTRHRLQNQIDLLEVFRGNIDDASSQLVPIVQHFQQNEWSLNLGTNPRDVVSTSTFRPPCLNDLQQGFLPSTVQSSSERLAHHYPWLVQDHGAIATEIEFAPGSSQSDDNNR